VSGSLSLAGHRRYDALIDDLRTQLLRLRLKGQCQPAPEAAELQALTERPGDPLIAVVARQLRQRLDQQAAAGAETAATEAAAITRAALCQLYALVETHAIETPGSRLADSRIPASRIPGSPNQSGVNPAEPSAEPSVVSPSST
jgi:hypothetical protein